MPAWITRLIRGNPPAVDPADCFVRYGFFAAWVMGLIAIVGGVTPLIAPAGLIIAACGVIVFKNFHGALDLLRERRKRSWSYRLNESNPTKFTAALMVIIGVAWMAMGIAAAAQSL